MRQSQALLHQSDYDRRREYQTFLPKMRPMLDFKQRAFKHALEHATLVANQRDPSLSRAPSFTSRLFGKSKSSKKIGAEGIEGSGSHWFYSIVEPTHPLGRDMGLPQDQLASILWKHDKGKLMMMHMDFVQKHPDVPWDLKPLTSLIEGVQYFHLR